MSKILFAIEPLGENVILDGLEKDIPKDGIYDFVLEQCDHSGRYRLHVETLLSFPDAECCKEWLEQVLDAFGKWCIKHDIPIGRVLDLHDVFTTGYNINSVFDDISTAYATLWLLVHGFEGTGLEEPTNE